MAESGFNKEATTKIENKISKIEKTRWNMKKIFVISVIFLICAVGKTATDSNNTIVPDSNITAGLDSNTTGDCQEKIKKLERVIESQRKTIEKQRDELIYLRKLCSDAGIQVIPKDQRKATDGKYQQENIRPTYPNTSGKTTTDKWSGFRDLKWGVNIKMNDPNMILLEEDKKAEATFYRRADDKLFIGRAELSRLIYCCYKGRFYGIHIETDGLSNFQYLKDAIFAYYGEGYQPNEYIEQWLWSGNFPKGDKNVRMLLEYNEFSKKGTLVMNYMPIQKEIDADDDAKAKKADKDFK